MKIGLFSKLATTVAAFGMLAGVAQAHMIAQPGETMGVALGAPLPEGVFFADLEDYGGADNTNVHVGVNIPLILWSTPYTFYDTRLEFLYAAPFTHIDGSAPGGPSNSRLDFYSQLFAPILAHDFGNGFNGSLLLGVRSPDVANGHDYVGTDIRATASYVKDGWDLSATFYYNGTFGGYQGGPSPIVGGVTGASDAVDVDFTATHKFGKLELGLVGFAFTDVNTRGDNVVTGRQGAIGLGGLIGYAFDKFTIQGMVTRRVAQRNIGTEETRGWLRVIVPLYVAPTAPAPIRARY